MTFDPACGTQVRWRPDGARWHCDDAHVPIDRFASRLDPDTYAHDDEVIGVFEMTPGDSDALWLSARLFRRLTLIARAYELHALPLLDDPEPVVLNRSRCESLVDEIEFVGSLLNDPLTIRLAQSVVDYLDARMRRPSWDGTVTVEGD
jgi:hypothetical protein